QHRCSTSTSILHMTSCSTLFIFTHTTTTEIYTLSLHDALPIYGHGKNFCGDSQFLLVDIRATVILCIGPKWERKRTRGAIHRITDRKSTRLNSSHVAISYAVFCLKKKISEGGLICCANNTGRFY